MKGWVLHYLDTYALFFTYAHGGPHPLVGGGEPPLHSSSSRREARRALLDLTCPLRSKDLFPKEELLSEGRRERPFQGALAPPLGEGGQCTL